MKIENKTTEIADEEGNHLTFANIMMLTVNGAVAQGMEMDELRKRVDLIEALDASTEHIELDEEQTVFMRQLWAKHRWRAAHPDIVKVDEAVKK